MIDILCVYKVLIIGGGDGGTIREISKHSLVKEIHQCELDKVYNSLVCIVMNPLIQFKVCYRSIKEILT